MRQLRREEPMKSSAGTVCTFVPSNAICAAETEKVISNWQKMNFHVFELTPKFSRAPSGMKQPSKINDSGCHFLAQLR
jgi:hypothetical protein